MNTYENNTDSEYSVRRMILDQTPAGEVSKYEPISGPSYIVVMPVMRISPWDFAPDILNEILWGTETSQFTNSQLITDFSGEPYRVLKAIPVTVRSLDIGEEVEAAFAEGNIAWVARSRVQAINGLKAEILNTMEDFEANKDRLGPEPTRQLDVLRAHLERIPQPC